MIKATIVRRVRIIVKIILAAVPWCAGVSGVTIYFTYRILVNRPYEKLNNTALLCHERSNKRVIVSRPHMRMRTPWQTGRQAIVS